MGTADSLRLGAPSRGARDPRLGASPAWLAGLQSGARVSFIYGRDARVSIAAHARQEGILKAVEKLEDAPLCWKFMKTMMTSMQDTMWK